MYLIVDKSNRTTLQIVDTLTEDIKLSFNVFKCENTTDIKSDDFALLDWDGNLINSDLRYGKVLSYDDKSNLIHIKNQFGNESANKQYHVNTKIYKLIKQEYLYTKEEVMDLINKFYSQTKLSETGNEEINIDWLNSIIN